MMNPVIFREYDIRGVYEKDFDLSFAEMDLDDKNEISHRGRATRKLAEFLNKS